MRIRDENPCYYKPQHLQVSQDSAVLMLPLHAQRYLSQESLARCNLSNALLEVQWGIVHEDDSGCERSLVLLEHWAFCIQHEDSIKEFAKLNVFPVCYLYIPESPTLPALILHSLFPFLFAFHRPTSCNYRQLFISLTLVHAAETLCHPLDNLIYKKLVKVLCCPDL